MSSKPIVWLLLGARQGDNSQVLELASRLPVTSVPKQLAFNALHHLPNAILGAGISTLTADAREQLKAPWPDAVIAAGKRSAPIARWIKAQSNGRTKLIHIGRPRAPLSAFDLVLTTPQYGLPDDAQVMELPLPLTARRVVDAASLDGWRAAWQDLPRPLFCVAVGAQKFPIRLGEVEARELAGRLNSVIDAAGGSAVVLASPRSDAKVMQVLGQSLSVPHRVYAPFLRETNPYAAALTLCDRAIVTSDSASMIADALTLDKPVDVFRLPVSSARVAWNGKRGLGAALSRSGLLQQPRAMARIVDRLLRDGYVGELGGRAATQRYVAPDRAILERVAGLLSSR